jgi:hypothetical protein
VLPLGLTTAKGLDWAFAMDIKAIQIAAIKNFLMVIWFLEMKIREYVMLTISSKHETLLFLHEKELFI